MIFNRLILISAVESSMLDQILELSNKGRMPAANVATAKTRVQQMRVWLESQSEDYFPAEAVNSSEEYKNFERKAVIDFSAART